MERFDLIPGQHFVEHNVDVLERQLGVRDQAG
jgi:hypothetical protein